MVGRPLFFISCHGIAQCVITFLLVRRGKIAPSSSYFPVRGRIALHLTSSLIGRGEISRAVSDNVLAFGPRKSSTPGTKTSDRKKAEGDNSVGGERVRERSPERAAEPEFYTVA